MFGNVIFGYAGQEKETYTNRPRNPLGTRLIVPDGREFRLAYNGASAGVGGKVVQPAAVTSNHVDLAVATTAAGSYTVAVTLGATAVVADEYKDGFLVVEDSAANGAGHAYAIGPHAAVAASGTFTVPLNEPLKEATLNGTTKVALIRSPYYGVVIQPSPPTLPVVGVWTHDMAASVYGWVQVKGLGPAFQDGALTAAKSVMPSDATDGAVEVFALTEGTPNAEIYKPIGVCVRNNATGETGTVIWDI